jgi:hypothetical protein
MEEIEELIHELVIRRQREPLQHSASDRRPNRADKLGVCALYDQSPKALRMCDRELQSDSASEGNAEDRRGLQTQPIDQLGEVVGISGDAPPFQRHRFETERRKCVAPQLVHNHLESARKATRERQEQSPASREAGHQHNRPAPAQSHDINILAADSNPRSR